VDSSGGEDLLGDFGIEGVAARAGGLDVERDWVNLLGLSEQQLLVLSRVALARPEFAFLFRIDTTLRAAETMRALKARSITCVTFSDSDTLRDEHDCVLRLDGSGSWTMKWRIRRRLRCAAMATSKGTPCKYVGARSYVLVRIPRLDAR